MAHPFIELAKLTAKSKQIDGMGFGGTVADNLAVAGALALRNPETGKKISREAYNLARFVFVGDSGHRFKVKAALYERVQRDTGNLREETVFKLCNAALREFLVPKTRLNKLGEQEIVAKTNHALANEIGISHKNYTETHDNLYRKALSELYIWSNEVSHHIKLCLEGKAA